ncbi:MAG: hypothetical protein LLG04_14985 [Parachlamydia sp.]|nr:hypothetical protein [Parachlamydia sp.]
MSAVSTLRDLYGRIDQLRQETSTDSDFDRRFQSVIKDDLHRLRALCNEKRSCSDFMGMQIAALERLQPFINDLQRSVTNQDRTLSVRVIGEHQGALSDEIAKAKAGLAKCEEKIVQCEKEIPENVQKWEEKRLRKIAKRLLLEEAKNAFPTERSRLATLQAAVSSYDREIKKLEAKLSNYNQLGNRLRDPMTTTGNTLSELRSVRGMKDDLNSHIDFLSFRFDSFIVLAGNIQDNRWSETRSLRVIAQNHSDSLVMMRKIRQGAQEELQMHEAMMQTSLKADKLFQMISSQKLSEDETLQAEWLPKWTEIESVYRSYRAKALT